MKVHAITATLLGIAFLSSSAMAAKAAPKPGDNVSVAACVRPGVEGSCLMITGADGTVFNITSANPKPPRDVVIELRGKVTDKLSACNQGVVLDNISWTATTRKCGN